MRKSSDSSQQPRRRTFDAHATCIREILFVYLCIFLVESACLFPDVFGEVRRWQSHATSGDILTVAIIG